MRTLMVLFISILSSTAWAQQPPPQGVSSSDWSQDSFVKNTERSQEDVSNFVNSILGAEDRKTVEVDRSRDGNAAAVAK